MHQWKTITFDERDFRTLRETIHFVSSMKALGQQVADGSIEGSILEDLAAPASSLSWEFLEEIEKRFEESDETPPARSDSLAVPDPLTKRESEEARAMLERLLASDDQKRQRTIHTVLQSMKVCMDAEPEGGAA